MSDDRRPGFGVPEGRGEDPYERFEVAPGLTSIELLAGNQAQQQVIPTLMQSGAYQHPQFGWVIPTATVKTTNSQMFGGDSLGSAFGDALPYMGMLAGMAGLGGLMGGGWESLLGGEGLVGGASGATTSGAVGGAELATGVGGLETAGAGTAAAAGGSAVPSLVGTGTNIFNNLPTLPPGTSSAVGSLLDGGLGSDGPLGGGEGEIFGGLGVNGPTGIPLDVGGGGSSPWDDFIKGLTDTFGGGSESEGGISDILKKLFGGSGGFPWGQLLGALGNNYTQGQYSDDLKEMFDKLVFSSNPLNDPQRQPYQTMYHNLMTNPDSFQQTPFAQGQLNLLGDQFEANVAKFGPSGTQFADYNDRAQDILGKDFFNLANQFSTAGGFQFGNNAAGAGANLLSGAAGANNSGNAGLFGFLSSLFPGWTQPPSGNQAPRTPQPPSQSNQSSNTFYG